MPIVAGTRLAHYEILEPIGKGGMGEVYRAKDLKLHRDVAVKVLREDIASSPDRLRRFEQEARAASALNHPNIITIYDIGKHGPTSYIAMEYVDGKTLRKMLDGGPLPTKKLLQVATQIAEGLAKAHSAGIAHRDLKPENLIITNDGLVKILDFGLAKLLPESSVVDSEKTTMAKGTREGLIIGTMQYMSPEQAAGRPIDHRSDQFSFGVVLYEMGTGSPAFKRDTGAETLTAIIREEPKPLAVLNTNLPFHFRWVVEHCLAKNPEERYDSTRDLARELQGALEGFLHSGEAISTVAKASSAGHSKDTPKYSLGLKNATLAQELAKLIARAQLSIRNNISHITFNRSDKIIDTINDIAKKMPGGSDEVFSVNQASGQIIVVCESDNETWFKNILPEAAEIRRKAAVIKVGHSKSERGTPGIDVPGLYAFFINRLSQDDINILEITSARTQLTILVDEEDLTRAYTALNECIKYFRSKQEP